MFKYSQSLGVLWTPEGEILQSGCYSGSGEGINNPEMQGVKNVGPIPRGLYVIGVPYASSRVGPYALPLTPSGHNALGRTHFRGHGDRTDPTKPRSASHGCPIWRRSTRIAIHSSGYKLLEVIE